MYGTFFPFRSVFFHLICTFPAVYTIQAKRSPPYVLYVLCVLYALYALYAYTFCELLPDSSPSHMNKYTL